MTDGRVRRLTAEQGPQVVDVLCDAFRDYPIMCFVLGSGPSDYDQRLRSLIHFFVSARTLREEPIFGVRDGERLVAVATVSLPDAGDPPPGLAELRDETWAGLGADARDRYESCGEAWRPLTVSEPHVHLNMLGVRHAAQGRGHARRLLGAVEAFSRDREGSNGVSLTTEDPANVAFYERGGYRVVGRAGIAPGLETWSFFRPDEA